MTAAAIECPMCGTSYAGTSGCDACPLNGSCEIACCPACGYGVVDGSRSVLVGLARRLGRHRRNAGTLADVAAGSTARILAVEPATAERVEAYGILPGRTIEVLQRSPVTVVHVDELDVAIEPSVARGVAIEVER